MSHAKVVVCGDEVGLQCESFLVAGDGRFELVQLAKKRAEVKVIVGDVWRVGDGAADEVGGLVELAGVGEDHGEAVEGAGVVGMFGENPAIDGLGLAEASGAVML
jgi:hypothetical protein